MRSWPGPAAVAGAGTTVPELSSSTATFALLAIVPIVLVVATAFAKSSVLLGAVRTGLGAEALLPMPVVLALAMVVTAIVMAPTAAAVLGEIDARGGPAAIDGVSGWWDTAAPWLEFLQRHADGDELSFFAELQARGAEDPLVIVPAFLVTELREALSMAVVVLVPLVVVDLLVAQAVTLLGFAQLQTALVSVPLKLLLFLAVGGWGVVIGGLVEGYR
jgi:type III secretory pathway component EscR